MDTFYYKDLAVSIDFSNLYPKILYDNPDGISVLHEVDVLKDIDLKNRVITVSHYWEWKGKVTDELIKSGRNLYKETNFLPFFNATNLPISLGEFVTKSIANGLVRRLEEFGGNGLRGEPGNTVVYKMPSGEFFQPVVLDEPILTPPTEGNTDGIIMVNVANGVAPYTYQLNDLTAQSTNEFTGLAAGQYTIKVTDNAGNWATQLIELN